MNVKELVTYSFARNVGPRDRALRIATGLALGGAAWFIGAPPWAAVALTIVGVMWTLTGVVGRCALYYMLGYSTCPHETRSHNAT